VRRHRNARRLAYARRPVIASLHAASSGARLTNLATDDSSGPSARSGRAVANVRAYDANAEWYGHAK
jgi:hypothetical protein